MTIKSLLFVPAKQKMLNKIADFNAGGYIIDLEDSIEEDGKREALLRTINVLPLLENKKIWIRINPEYADAEIKELMKFKVGFMLPKITSPQQYSKYSKVLEEHNVIALIETPKAIVNIAEIAKCHYIDALALGAEDYTASMNMLNNEQNLLMARLTILNYAKAFNKLAYDTPSFKVKDTQIFESEVKVSSEMGFDGKLCINPKHTYYIDKCFGQFDYEYMKKIIEQYEASSSAVVEIEGVVYEKMHINRYKKILKENGEI